MGEQLKRLTANIGLPLDLLEKHDTWSAYVIHTSPMVKRLIEKSKTPELECIFAVDGSQRPQRPSKLCNFMQLKRKKPSKDSGEILLKDTLSETMLSMWGTYSIANLSPAAAPEPAHLKTESRDSPTTNYNKIVFSRIPAMKTLPYATLQTNKKKHDNVQKGFL
uniref:CMT1A duplicated region transcript 4 protein n=1 Tax=Jaculus jaculus TaxID=51337 RepID=UPI000332FECB|nr:CMT1A duplicated region transcript 4 protein [Jaculus jaculus]